MSNFHTTSWTEIVRAQSDAETLGVLLERYRAAIVAFFRGRGRNADDAEDMTQGFIADVVLRRNIVQRADPKRARFRSFLVACLWNYDRDQRRTRPPVQGDGQIAATEDTGPPPEAAYDAEFARIVVTESIERLRAHYDDGASPAWIAFDGIVLCGIRGASTPADVLAARLRCSESQVYTKVAAAKRVLKNLVRERVAETLENPTQQGVQDEITQLWSALGVDLTA